MSLRIRLAAAWRAFRHPTPYAWGNTRPAVFMCSSTASPALIGNRPA